MKSFLGKSYEGIGGNGQEKKKELAKNREKLAQFGKTTFGTCRAN